jgi:PHD/YefM family antitoxin component YafN of YafNO toxin-antitoxin module
MTAIFPITSLQRNPSEVKKAAQDSIVHITEQGAAAFVFSSEKAFEERIAKEREDAAYEARLIEAVGRGIADIEAGRYYDDVDEAIAEARRLRAIRGTSAKNQA